MDGERELLLSNFRLDPQRAQLRSEPSGLHFGFVGLFLGFVGSLLGFGGALGSGRKDAAFPIAPSMRLL